MDIGNTEYAVFIIKEKAIIKKMLNQIKNITDEKSQNTSVFLPSSTALAGSGAAMDQKIEDSGKKWKFIIISSIAVIIVGVAIWSVMSLNGDRSFRAQADTLTIAKVTTGIFEDYIPIRGRIVPRTTVFLDAIEGGRVDRVYAEDGDILTKGDLLVSLSIDHCNYR